MKIHASGITKHGDIDFEAIVKLAENFNGADMRNVCTEAGMFAIRDERDYVVQEDFMKVKTTPPPPPVTRNLRRVPIRVTDATTAGGGAGGAEAGGCQEAGVQR